MTLPKDDSYVATYSVDDIDALPSAELQRDTEAAALASTLKSHALVASAQELMRRLAALKLRAAADSARRSEANTALLRGVFAGRRAQTVAATVGALAALDAAAEDVQRHLEGSLEGVLLPEP